ncbi:MAG: monovalent cation:proton antiporter-2 (CPA2) family protein [Hyphomicrobiaceae bacterium]|nr:monovalent cation:proton antiporter-2 (CPA2) family protein [Hyphomicrobiaceae bacterium]
MDKSYLMQAVVLLASAALAAPLARAMRIGSVLGYLAAGVVIGPYALGFFTDVEAILHAAELGIVFLLFLIGLELRPIRLWTMRRAIFGAGGLQVLASGLVLGVVTALLFTTVPVAAVVGTALAMSSTAFVLQSLDETKELNQKHGRLAFSILLFQDLAAIPLIAVVPMLAVRGATDGWQAAMAVATALATIAAVILGGRFVLGRVYRMVAASGVREAMTATALLTVIGVALIMQLAGLSAALGAFIAGALLADSEYRHQIEADIQPFEGLLLGLFFTAIGMSLDLGLLWREMALIVQLVAGLVVLKALVIFAIGRWQGLGPQPARRLAIVLSQGGEFAFVILGLVSGARLLAEATAELMAVVVTLSMVATPLLLLADDGLQRLRGKVVKPAYDTPPPAADGHVVIAGLGRFGQIVARILRARGVAFTALDISPEQIDLVRRFGAESYFGDASRLDILEAAQTAKARAFVLAIDDVGASLKTAEIVRQHFPHVPIYARARNRQHVHKLMDLGVVEMRRETFLAAIELTRDLLEGLGVSVSEARRITETFAKLDRKRLYDDYEHASDRDKLLLNAKRFAEELEQIFREDKDAVEKLAPTHQTARTEGRALPAPHIPSRPAE